MNKTRVEFFSDGVFAIAITLLVLEIKVPESGNIATGLLNLWPSYLAYAVSFIVIGAIWINHHAMFDWIARIDHQLLLLNTFHLLFIAFLPFPTAVLAEAFHTSSGRDIATAFYAGTLTVIGVLVNAMWWHAASRRELLHEAVSPELARAIGKRFLLGPAGYSLATILAFVNPWLSIAMFIGLNVYFLWPRRPEVVARKSRAPRKSRT
ncbi:MAG: Potassium channel [Anaerolineales bacterium]|nr:Potassium channel [Anaerolineales bacterium]